MGRLKLATNGRFGAAIDASFDLREQLAQLAIWHARVGTSCPPHHIAIGVFALALAAVHPSVGSVLQPPDVDPTVWNLTLAAVLMTSLSKSRSREVLLPEIGQAAEVSAQLDKAA